MGCFVNETTVHLVWQLCFFLSALRCILYSVTQVHSKDIYVVVMKDKYTYHAQVQMHSLIGTVRIRCVVYKEPTDHIYTYSTYVIDCVKAYMKYIYV